MYYFHVTQLFVFCFCLQDCYALSDIFLLCQFNTRSRGMDKNSSVEAGGYQRVNKLLIIWNNQIRAIWGTVFVMFSKTSLTYFKFKWVLMADRKHQILPLNSCFFINRSTGNYSQTPIKQPVFKFLKPLFCATSIKLPWPPFHCPEKEFYCFLLFLLASKNVKFEGWLSSWQITV